MRSLVSFLVLALLAGCGSMKGCGGQASPSSPATPASAAKASSSPPAPKAPEPPEARFAHQYLVIVNSAPTPGEAVDIVEKLTQAGLGAEVKRLPSTPFSSLRPCLEMVVAGAFADKDAAQAQSARVSQAGVHNYLKNTGAIAQDWQRREADCRQQAQARAEVAARKDVPGGPRFVDLRGQRSFVLLSSEPQETPGAKLSQVGADRGFWMAALKEDPTGHFKQGDSFDVYDAQGLLKAGCRVKGFASLNRGTPHFSYFQDEAAPKEPGCGSAWPAAELDCSLGSLARAMEQKAVLFALPGGSPAPRYYARSETVAAPVKTSLEAALRALPAFAKTRTEAEAHAQQQHLPLQQSVELRAFSEGSHQVVVGLAHFQTGEGNTECGGPDFQQTVSRVVTVGEGGQETAVGGDVHGDHILAVMDLEGDGHAELLTGDPLEPSRVSFVREDGSTWVNSFIPNCDCNC